MKKIAVIGSGSWGMALAIHAANVGNDVRVWSFNPEEADEINNEHRCRFLPNVEVPNIIKASTDIEEVVRWSDIILHVTPSKFVRETIKKYKDFVTTQPVIMCSKGFEKSTQYTLSQVMEEEMPNAKIGAFVGPSHAEEVAIKVPTALVVGSKDYEVQDLIQTTFMSENLRIYTTSDIKGVELGAALKNIIAFCAGVAAGLGLGDNTFAALITRGLVEVSKLGVAMGGCKETFYGLTGLGDLIVTCLSEHSRNRRAGKLIGQGKTVEEVREEIGMTIESIDNIEVTYQLSKKYNIEMPIVDAVYAVLNQEMTPREGVTKLMTRDKKSEL